MLHVNTGNRESAANPGCLLDAPDRVAQGTFGTCIVDGRPVDESRLKAVPWSLYCLKHAGELEVAAFAETADLVTAV